MNKLFDRNTASEGHARKSLHGGAFSLVARGINAVVQIGSVLCLARLLSPEDYGLVAMVIAVTGFAPVLVDLGTRDAVVQRESISQGEVSALFWITMLVGCVFTVGVGASGPLVAHFYGEPRLSAITRVSALAFVASALACQHQALMRRAMMFRNLAVIEVVSNVLGSLAAILFAWRGHGYWALVLRPITTSFILAVGVWLGCRWWPSLPRFSTGVKDMIKFGLNLTGFCMTDFVARCSDRVALGHRSGPGQLGYYQQACLVYDNLLDLTVALHGVAVVSLSKLRDNLDELRRLWAKGLSTLAFYAMPAFGVLVVTSQDLIVFLLGDKWAQAGVVLSVLALRGIPHVVERTLGWLHVAAGRADRWFRWGIVATVLQLIALFCGLPYGPTGVAAAYAICMFILFIPAIAYAGQPLGIGFKHVVKAVGWQVVGALLAVALGFELRLLLSEQMPRLLRLVLLGSAYAAIYLLLVAGIFKVRAPLALTVSLLRDVAPARLLAALSLRLQRGPKKTS